MERFKLGQAVEKVGRKVGAGELSIFDVDSRADVFHFWGFWVAIRCNKVVKEGYGEALFIAELQRCCDSLPMARLLRLL